MKMMSEDLVSQIKSDINVVIGRQIMLPRKSKGLTGHSLAKILGLSQQQISRYERGISKFDTDTLIIVLMHFDVPLDFFFKKVSLDLKACAPKNYRYYHAVFPSLLNKEDSGNRYYLIKADGESDYFRLDSHSDK